ncbi:VanZ family protein [Virgibacillus sp. DJP39]|uniref:VanZ family protein n=1 Tax=Virgibacillus sp. DJP39 TaxID=3409790 RepID=UPI003BB4A5E3
MLIDFEGPILIMAILLWLIILMFLKKKLKKPIMYLVFFTIFYIYLCSLLSYTQFPIIMDQNMREEMGQTILRQGNLIPFNPDHFAIKTSLLNVLLTIPFGFGLPFIIKTNFKRIVISGILVGFFLETLQLIIFLFIGYTFRLVDVNDIIFNFSGVVIGYFIFKRFMILFKLLIHKFDIHLNSFLKYIHDTK